MASSQIVGLALVVAGILDAVVGMILAQRVVEESKRRIFATSLAVSAAAMVGLGVAFLAGAVG
jgi:uncharacterized membrane protein YfcA